MPEMRAETEREAKRKGIAGIEKATDPYELTSASEPTEGRGGDGLTRAERVLASRPLRRGETGGPS